MNLNKLLYALYIYIFFFYTHTHTHTHTHTLFYLIHNATSSSQINTTKCDFTYKSKQNIK